MLDPTSYKPAMRRGWQRTLARVLPPPSDGLLGPILISLAYVAAVTACLFGARGLIALDHAALAYLIPVIVATTRWGILPAVIAAMAGAACSAFFFYPPIYDFRVYDPEHVADLLLFAFVAVITGQLANSVREHVNAARQREEEIKALYFFSRRLAAASGPADMHAAIQEHLSAITGCRVVLLAAGAGQPHPEASHQWHQLPPAVQGAVAEIAGTRRGDNDAPLVDAATGASWLVRSLSQRSSAVGMLAIELGHVSAEGLDAIRRRVDTAIGEAADTLERIDVAHALGEARLRSEAEMLREALIGSVSHELRTPLASILGSASILAQAPGIAGESRLASLVDVIRGETERLNNDIQNLLDASRISSAGVKAHMAWAEPSDIVNAALERQRRRLAGHNTELAPASELPLVRVDAVLVEQALSQIIDNAAKYSRPGTTIKIAAEAHDGCVRIAIADQGAGLSAEEQARLFERFYRGPRHTAAIAGSGLGLWIARAFVTASGGQIEATSGGTGSGATITVSLPAPALSESDHLGEGDE
jgi:two-component system sensor histidine kinase KdpD